MIVDLPSNDTSEAHKPDWLKIRPPSGERFTEIQQSLREHDLHTVCEEANCPNMGDCCSRGCNFCDVETGGMEPPKPDEPANVSEAVADIGLE